MIREYRQLPPVVRAVQWTGHNISEFRELFPDAYCDELSAAWLIPETHDFDDPGHHRFKRCDQNMWALRDADNRVQVLNTEDFKLRYAEVQQ